ESAANLVRSGPYARQQWRDEQKGNETPATAAPSTYVSTYMKSASFGRSSDLSSPYISANRNASSTTSSTTLGSSTSLGTEWQLASCPTSVSSNTTASLHQYNRSPYRQQSDSTVEKSTEGISSSIPLSVITNLTVPSSANGVTTANSNSLTGTETSVGDARDRRRSYLTPVRDEEAESLRKARSRQARQTRRSTQHYGVRPRDISLCSHQAGRHHPAAHSETEVKSWILLLLRGDLLPCHHPEWAMSSLYTRSKEFTRNRKSQSDSPPSSPSPIAKTLRHERLPRLDAVSSSTGTSDTYTDRPTGRNSSYTRRENRLAALTSRTEDDSGKDYRRLYESALTENQKLKSKLQDAQVELVDIKAKMEKIAQQKQEKTSDRSSMLEMEKREKRALERKLSEMEEEMKVESSMRISSLPPSTGTETDAHRHSNAHLTRCLFGCSLGPVPTSRIASCYM
ncbi:Protein phosphatase 1 regulatory subunit 12B, partial [Varanus komodoensis]